MAFRRYILECGTCAAWAESDNPRAEFTRHICPKCQVPMYLLSRPNDIEMPMLFRARNRIDLPNGTPIDPKELA